VKPARAAAGVSTAVLVEEKYSTVPSTALMLADGAGPTAESEKVAALMLVSSIARSKVAWIVALTGTLFAWSMG
jgi:hypothetical protein